MLFVKWVSKIAAVLNDVKEKLIPRANSTRTLFNDVVLLLNRDNSHTKGVKTSIVKHMESETHCILDKLNNATIDLDSIDVSSVKPEWGTQQETRQMRKEVMLILDKFVLLCEALQSGIESLPGTDENSEAISAPVFIQTPKLRVPEQHGVTGPKRTHQDLDADNCVASHPKKIHEGYGDDSSRISPPKIQKDEALPSNANPDRKLESVAGMKRSSDQNKRRKKNVKPDWIARFTEKLIFLKHRTEMGRVTDICYSMPTIAELLQKLGRSNQLLSDANTTEKELNPTILKEAIEVLLASLEAAFTKLREFSQSYAQIRLLYSSACVLENFKDVDELLNEMTSIEALLKTLCY